MSDVWNMTPALLEKLIESVNALAVEVKKAGRPRRPPKGKTWCPEVRDECWRERCDAWMELTLQDPQEPTKTIREWGCSLIHWDRKLQLEGIQHTRHLGAAIEDFRNEAVKSNQMLAGSLASLAALAADARRQGQQQGREMEFVSDVVKMVQDMRGANGERTAEGVAERSD